MNDKKSFCLLIVCFCVFHFPNYAQINSINIVGEVTEARNNKPIPFATIQVFKDSLASRSVYSCISDSIGMFKMKLKPSGKYKLVLSCVGKQSKSIDVNLGHNSLIDLGKVKMDDSNNEIEAISVIGSKPIVEVHSDMLVYNVSNDPMALSSDLLSITEKVPLLNVEPELGILLNNCTPLILINGRESRSVNKNPIFYLSNISASRVSKIEVITSAGSKYNSDANCGVINIIYKKRDNQSLTVGAKLYSMTGYNAYLDCGFKYKKFILNTNVGYSNGKNYDSKE